jgi:hypothetical protein
VQPERVFLGHESAVEALAFGGLNKRFLISAASDKTMGVRQHGCMDGWCNTMLERHSIDSSRLFAGVGPEDRAVITEAARVGLGVVFSSGCA